MLAPLLALPFLLQSAAAAPIGARAPLDVRPETFRHYCEPKQSSYLDFTHTTVNKCVHPPAALSQSRRPHRQDSNLLRARRVCAGEFTNTDCYPGIVSAGALRLHLLLPPTPKLV